MVTLGELILFPVHNAGPLHPLHTCPSFCCSGYHCLNFSGHLDQACLPTVSPTTRDMPHILPALQMTGPWVSSGASDHTRVSTAETPVPFCCREGLSSMVPRCSSPLSSVFVEPGSDVYCHLQSLTRPYAVGCLEDHVIRQWQALDQRRG